MEYAISVNYICTLVNTSFHSLSPSSPQMCNLPYVMLAAYLRRTLLRCIAIVIAGQPNVKGLESVDAVKCCRDAHARNLRM